jgi:hypothetical protein
MSNNGANSNNNGARDPLGTGNAQNVRGYNDYLLGKQSELQALKDEKAILIDRLHEQEAQDPSIGIKLDEVERKIQALKNNLLVRGVEVEGGRRKRNRRTKRRTHRRSKSRRSKSRAKKSRRSKH